MPVPFEDKTVEYYMDVRVNEDDEDTTRLRGKTNPETWQLMKNRYVVLRDFLPKHLIKFAMDTWRVDEERDGHYTNQELHDITYKNPLSSRGTSKGGYCTPWGVALHGFIHNKLKDYIDMDLRETYSFTRKYERGAYLGTHVDRPSCEISATLCLDYKTDDNKPWKIWVRNDRNYAKCPSEQIKEDSQDFNHRERPQNNCKAISLEPGDILSRQSGAVLNPNMELLFGGVQLRTFSFDFDFAPRDRKESEVIKKIIRSFKISMNAKQQAEGEGNGLFIKSPDVFQLTYKTGSDDHLFLHRFKPMAMLNMAVNYTGAGTYATYDNTSPVHMKLNLTFQELNPIYSEDYEDGEGTEGTGF